MNKLTKLCLAVAVIGLVSGMLISTGVIKVGDAVGWYLALPTGAIFLGLFLICLMLEKETARFDAEHRAHHAAQAGEKAEKCEAAESSCGCHSEPQHVH